MKTNKLAYLRTCVLTNFHIYAVIVKFNITQVERKPL